VFSYKQVIGFDKRMYKNSARLPAIQEKESNQTALINATDYPE
jgi:hypothetical protein